MATASPSASGGVGTSPADDDPASLRSIRRTGRSIGVATGLYGISYGALATAAGLDVWQAMVLSVVMFTGGSPFAFVGVISGGGSAVGAALAALLLGVRNTLYGLTLAPVLPWGGWRGLLRAQLTIDESAALAASGTSAEAKRTGFWAAGVWVYVFWNVFALIGALAGRYVAAPGAWGLDAAAAAAFLALLWPRLRRADAVAIAVAAAFVALLTTPVLPSGLPVLAAALVAAVAGLLPRRPAAGPDGPCAPSAPPRSGPGAGKEAR